MSKLYPFCDPKGATIRCGKHNDVLLDEDGDLLFAFAPGTPGEVIWRALDFANSAYLDGYNDGKDAAALMLRTLAGIKT